MGGFEHPEIPKQTTREQAEIERYKDDLAELVEREISHGDFWRCVATLAARGSSDLKCRLKTKPH